MIRTPAEMKTEVREQMRGGDGVVTVRHFFDADEITARARLCATLTLPPGASIGTHQHNGEDEVYIITRGTGIISDGETQSRVSTGDAILTGNGESHALRNDGTEPLVVIAVIMSY